MAALSIQVPFPTFLNRDGLPLDNGYVWVGAANLEPITNPVVVYANNALTIPLQQPLRTINGYIAINGSPTQVYVDAGDFSIRVADSKNNLVYSFLTSTGINTGAGAIAYTPNGTSLLPPGSVADALNNLSNNTTGATRIGFLQAGANAVGRTVQAKLRDVYSVKDFGAVGDGVVDDTNAIQRTIDAVIATATAFAGTVYFPHGRYRITAALRLGIGVHLNLNGSTIVQATSNIPVVRTPIGADVYHWGIENGILEYAVQQSSAQTGAVGLLISSGNFSYNFFVKDLQVSFACDGIGCPGTSGTFAFVGHFEQVLAVACSRYGFNIDCDTAIGANTNLSFLNCWALQSAGSPIPGSRGFRFRGCSQSRWEAIFGDHLRGPFLEMESCTGEMGCITPESCLFDSTSGVLSIITLADCSLTIESLRWIANTFTVGANDIYMFRVTSSGPTQKVVVRQWLASSNVYGGTLANLYEVNPSTGVIFENDYAFIDRTAQFADFALPLRISRWNGVERTGYVTSGRVVYGTAPPSSGAWVRGDRCLSTDVSDLKPVVEWVCSTAGSPGSWTPSRWLVPRNTTANRPSLTVADKGVGYLDTTIAAAGAPITWTGTAWVNSVGVVV